MPLRVLIVEDEIAILNFIAETLSSLGLEVRPVSDSQQAASMIHQEKFDAIFLDLVMPKMDGFELAGLIRQSSWNGSTPIFIITGLEDQETMQRAFAAGATFFLQKPIGRQELTRLFRIAQGVILRSAAGRGALRSRPKCCANLASGRLPAGSPS